MLRKGLYLLGMRRSSLIFKNEVKNDLQEYVIKYFLCKSLNNAVLFFEAGVKLGP